MKKRTLVAKLLELRRQQEGVKGVDLHLVQGGIKTITQDAGGHVIVIDGDTIQI